MSLPIFPILDSSIQAFNKLTGITSTILLKFNFSVAGQQLFFKPTLPNDHVNALAGVSFELLNADGVVVPTSPIDNFFCTPAPLAKGYYYLKVTSTTADLDVILGYQNWDNWIGFTNFVVTPPVAPTQTIDQMISDAFVSAKTYIDAKDAGLKAYTDAALAQLMNTTDLTAKLALLEQINTILDGDAATAGFQAWQAALTRLNAIETKAISDVLTLETKITNAHESLNALINTTSNDFTTKINANKTAADSVDAAISARVLTLETTTHSAVTASVSTLDTKVTTSVATVQTGINANFAAMKAKAAILFAV